MQFGFNLPSDFGKKNRLKMFTTTTTTATACLYYNLTYEPKGSGKLKPYIAISMPLVQVSYNMSPPSTHLHRFRKFLLGTV